MDFLFYFTCVGLTVTVWLLPQKMFAKVFMIEICSKNVYMSFDFEIWLHMKDLRKGLPWAMRESHQE